MMTKKTLEQLLKENIIYQNTYDKENIIINPKKI